MTVSLEDPVVRSRGHSHARTFRYTPELVPGVVHVLELLLIGLVGSSLCIRLSTDRPEYLDQHIFCVVFIVISYSVMANLARLTTLNALMRPMGQADNVIVVVFTTFLLLLSLLYGLNVSYIFGPEWLMKFAAGSLVVVLAVRLSAFAILSAMSRNHLIGRNLVVLGTGDQGARVLRRIRRDRPYFTEIEGVYADGNDDVATECIEDFPVLGDTSDLLRHAREGLIDDIIVARQWNGNGAMTETIEKLKELPVNVYFGSDLAGFDLTFKPMLGTTSQLPAFEVTQRPISGWNSASKKLLDYVVATVALVLLSPLLALVALAIKLDSPGPVFFMQQRLGFNNRPFSIYKFRSMYHHQERDGVVRQATKGDPRITRVGRIIRATSIDELPQFLNVLDGTMSVVGPRPHAVSHNQEYGEKIRGYFARHKVKPGITGWAQVNGLRGETLELEEMRQRVEYDVYYTENWSLLFDIKIIITTAFVVLLQKTAY